MFEIRCFLCVCVRERQSSEPLSADCEPSMRPRKARKKRKQKPWDSIDHLRQYRTWHSTRVARYPMPGPHAAMHACVSSCRHA
eukprot:1107692-Rhodomonas_salina.2